MDTELEHAKKVARRKLELRVIGFVALFIVFILINKQVSINYMMFCIGCAMIQSAYLDYPNPSRPDRFLLISPFETQHPSTHALLFWGIGLISAISLILELWLGFKFVGWKFILILVSTTFGTDLIITGLSKKYPLYLVIMVLMVTGLFISISSLTGLK